MFDLARYSAHSLQVWTCVLLDEVNMPPHFIQARLSWMGNSFRMYLRDTGVIQDKHLTILHAELQEVIDLIENNTKTQMADIAAGLMNLDLDNKMGNYANDMD